MPPVGAWAIGVLGVDADRGEGGEGAVTAQRAQVHEIRNRHGYSAFECRGAGQASADRYPAIHHQVHPLHLVPGGLEGPQNSSRVSPPTGGVAGTDVIQVEVVALRGLHRAQPQSAVPAESHRHIRAVGQSYGQTQAGVVVGVFAHEVDPSGRGPHP